MSSDRKLLLALTTVLLALLAIALPASAASDSPPIRRASGQVFLPLVQHSPGSDPGHGLLPPVDENQTYVLREGDDLSLLAFDLGRDVSLMACVTPDSHVPLHELRPGQTIVIPSARYICHTVQGGETLGDLAIRYQVDAEAIVATPWNRLAATTDALSDGQRLLILDAVRPEGGDRSIPQPDGAPEPTPSQPVEETVPSQESAPAEEATAAVVVIPAEAATPAEIWPYGDGNFIWPVRAAISQDFRSGHRAIDIAAPFGRQVVAADNGVIKKVGWTETGYGLRVVIDHQIDYTTLYAHLSEVYVEEGQVVEKGQVIGSVGSTGNSSGPHVHFEIRDFGYLIDPMRLLPQ